MTNAATGADLVPLGRQKRGPDMVRRHAWLQHRLARSAMVAVLTLTTMAGALASTASPAAAASWSDWEAIGAPPNSGGVWSGISPAATSRPTGETDLVVASSNGNVYHRWYTPSNGWSKYGSLGSP